MTIVQTEGEVCSGDCLHVQQQIMCSKYDDVKQSWNLHKWHPLQSGLPEFVRLQLVSFCSPGKHMSKLDNLLTVTFSAAHNSEPDWRPFKKASCPG